MKFCNQDISKSIIARRFKLSQQIKDNEYLVEIKKKQLFYLYRVIAL